MLNTLKNWLESHFGDFDALLPELSLFISSIVEEKLKIMIENVLKRKLNPDLKLGKSGRESVSERSVLSIGSGTKNALSRMIKRTTTNLSFGSSIVLQGSVSKGCSISMIFYL